MLILALYPNLLNVSIHEKYVVNMDLFISLESQLEDLRMDLDSIRCEKKQLEI